MLVPIDFLYTTSCRLAVNNNFCDSIRLIPSPIDASLELSVYLQPFLRYWDTEILSVLAVTTLTFQGHVTSSAILVIRFAVGHFLLVVC